MLSRFFSILLVVTTFGLASAPEIAAHGMGARYFAQRLDLRIGTEWVHVVYVLEVPLSILQREFVDVARQHRDVPLADLKRDFRERKADEIRQGLELRLNDHHLVFEQDPDGEGEVRPSDRVFMMYRYALRAPIEQWLQGENALEIHNGNYEGRDTLYSLAVEVGDGIEDLRTGLEGDERFFVDPNTEIAWYPASKHRNPTIRFRKEAGVKAPGGAGASGVDVSSTSRRLAPGNGLERLFDEEPKSLSAMLVALFLAFTLGAAHGLSPGHGKATTAAYLAGSRARVSDALVLGAALGMTHVAVAIGLAFATLAVLEWVLPETGARYLSLASGVLVVLVGTWMLRRRHAFEAGTVVPATDDGAEVQAHAGPRLRELLALGISGGLVPSPGAVAVLLVGIASGREIFTVAMVVAFGLGVGGLLTTVGVVTVLAHRDVGRWLGAERGAWSARLPMASAAVVILSGLDIIVRALLDQGLPSV